jgi:hypothetical protein
MAIAKALEAGTEAVVIAVGYPLTRQQRALVETTVAAAGRIRADVDAILVASAGEVALHVRPGDEVEVVASGLERRRLARAVAAAIGSDER